MTYERQPDNFDRRDQRMLGLPDPGPVDYNHLSATIAGDTNVASTERAKTTSADGSYGLDEAEYGSGGVVPSDALSNELGSVRQTSGESTVGTDDFTGDVRGEINAATEREE